MVEPRHPGETPASVVIDAINAKLNANRGILAKSRYGRITYRLEGNDRVDVSLEPKL